MGMRVHVPTMAPRQGSAQRWPSELGGGGAGCWDFRAAPGMFSWLVSSQAPIWNGRRFSLEAAPRAEALMAGPCGLGL